MDSYSSFSSNPSSSGSTSIAANNNAKEKQQQQQQKKKKGTGGKLSTDPQSVAARQRRHRISDRFKILQSLVPGGSKMDTVSMLEQAIQYVKFLKHQILLHQSVISTLADQNPNYHDPNTTSAYYNIPPVPNYDCSSLDHPPASAHHQVVDHHHSYMSNNNNSNYSSSSWDDQIMLQGGEMTETDEQQLGLMPWFHSDDENWQFDASLPGPFN